MTDAGRMLIVDDEAPVRDVLSDYFSERGYAVMTAADGQAALAAFARERPDVVLLDVRMPGLDGLAVLRRFRQADPDVAVIMVTANDDLAVARETLSVGAFDYVAKPFDFEHLNRMVATAVVHSAQASPRAVGSVPSGPWTSLVVEVFRVVREMEPPGRSSTGIRLEDAALGAARQGLSGRPAQATQHLAEITLLVAVAGKLGDLSAAGRSAIEQALRVVEAALPPR